ncbi:MAG: arylamine N-acetyltransferase [Acidimicrobiales bacterium]
MALEPELLGAYLDRLGLDAEPPSVPALQRLHRRQVERVPYETMWIHAGDAWGIDPQESARRIALDRRGGYCFHLNGALAELLDALGYAVTRHVGGVHGPAGPAEAELTNHLVLTVAGLPTDEHPDGTWYVDAGLGDALYEAVPLAAAVHHQGPFRLELDAVPDGVGDWHLAHDPSGGFAGMSWRAAEATLADFAERHAWLSTSPDSGFVRIATAQRRDATGVDVMRGLVLTRIGDGAAPGAPLTERADWFDALGDLFDLRFEASPPAALDRLWARVLDTHREWEAAGST